MNQFSVTTKRLFVMFAFLMLAGCNEKPAEEVVEEAPIKAIQYIEVKNQAISQKRRLSGYIKSVTLAELSFQVQGKLIHIAVNAGDFVTKGQILANIDPEPFQHKVAQAQAELASALAGYNERSENFNRQEQLFQRGLVNKNTIDKAKADLEQADSLVALAQAKVKLKQQDLNNTRLQAPFDGAITRRDIEQFEEVSHQQTILEIQDKSALEVVFLLPTSLANAIKKNDQVNINIPSANVTQHIATISKISTNKNIRGAFNVSATLTPSKSNVLIGMTADVYINVLSEDSGIVLPESAIGIDALGNEQVFIYHADKGKVFAKTITSKFLSTEYLRITSGVKAGDIICSAGVEFLYDGQPVTLYHPRY